MTQKINLLLLLSVAGSLECAAGKQPPRRTSNEQRDPNTQLVGQHQPFITDQPGATHVTMPPHTASGSSLNLQFGTHPDTGDKWQQPTTHVVTKNEAKTPVKSILPEEPVATQWKKTKEALTIADERKISSLKRQNHVANLCKNRPAPVNTINPVVVEKIEQSYKKHPQSTTFMYTCTAAEQQHILDLSKKDITTHLMGFAAVLAELKNRPKTETTIQIISYLQHTSQYFKSEYVVFKAEVNNEGASTATLIDEYGLSNDRNLALEQLKKYVTEDEIAMFESMAAEKIDSFLRDTSIKLSNIQYELSQTQPNTTKHDELSRLYDATKAKQVHAVCCREIREIRHAQSAIHNNYRCSRLASIARTIMTATQARDLRKAIRNSQIRKILLPLGVDPEKLEKSTDIGRSQNAPQTPQLSEEEIRRKAEEESVEFEKQYEAWVANKREFLFHVLRDEIKRKARSVAQPTDDDVRAGVEEIIKEDCTEDEFIAKRKQEENKPEEQRLIDSLNRTYKAPYQNKWETRRKTLANMLRRKDENGKILDGQLIQLSDDENIFYGISLSEIAELEKSARGKVVTTQETAPKTKPTA